jgi:hypothetical protein
MIPLIGFRRTSVPSKTVRSSSGSDQLSLTEA